VFVSVTPCPLAFCITELDPGGAERMLVELVCRLDRRRWRPTVISLGSGDGPLIERLRDAEIDFRCLGARCRWDVMMVFKLVGELKRIQPRLLQTWLFHGNVAGCLAARWAGVDDVITGNRVAERRRRWRAWIERFCVRRARRHICVSRDVAEFCRKWTRLEPVRIRVIPNGVDTARFDRAIVSDLSGLGIADDQPVIASVGRLDPQKDPLALIDVMERVLQSHPDAHLVLAGDGPLRAKVEQTIERSGLAGRIHLLGWIADVESLLARSSGVLLTSLWEGMPNVVLESMAAGVPVVTRAVEGVAELVEHGRTGWVVRDGGIDGLADAVEHLLDDPEQALAMGQHARRRAIEHFSLDVMVQRYEQMWQEVIDAGDLDPPAAS
jgi:starch synthase (maltosyl-transferring)